MDEQAADDALGEEPAREPDPRVYAHVDSTGLCDNVILLDPDPEINGGYPMDGLVPIDGLDPTPGIGWTYKRKKWTPPTVTT